MDVLSLKLSPRTVMGKKVKQLRRQGIVPVHLYGTDLAALALQIEAQVLGRMLPRVGTNVPLSIEVEGQEGSDICFVRDVQRHPVTEDVLHVDFMRVDIAQTIRAEVPVVVDGTAPAVRLMGGTLLQPQLTILVESLPMNIPVAFHIDVSELDDFEKSIYVRDVTVDPSVNILVGPDELLVRVSPPRIEAEGEGVEEEEGAEEAVDGEGSAEAETPAGGGRTA
jgi:large subunit ribosomal protein L25